MVSDEVKALREIRDELKNLTKEVRRITRHLAGNARQGESEEPEYGDDSES